MNVKLKSKAEWLCDEKYTLYDRHDYNRETAWFIVTAEAVATIARLIRNRKVVEVFAGSGFLAHHLREQAGLSNKDYKAYDNYPTQTWEKRYSRVTKKNAFAAPIKKADVVVMTWPLYDTPHAVRIVKKMRVGQILIYNGEGYGGCTGDDAFFDYIGEYFKPLEGINETLRGDHLTFPCIRDYWGVYTKIK